MLQRSRPNLQPASFVRRCGGRDTNRGPQSRLPSLYKCRGARMRGYSSRHQASLFTPGFNPITPHTSHTSTTTSLYSKYFQSHIHSPKRNISNMASATSVFDFKPLNSKSPPSCVQFAPVTIPIPLRVRRQYIPITPLLCTPTATSHAHANSPQRRASQHPSPPMPARFSSSSIPPPSAASPPSTAASRPSTRRLKPLTPASLSSSASPATNSAVRSPQPTTRSKSSARSTTASRSPSSARRMLTAIMPIRCGSTSRTRSRG